MEDDLNILANGRRGLEGCMRQQLDKIDPLKEMNQVILAWLQETKCAACKPLNQIVA